MAAVSRPGVRNLVAASLASIAIVYGCGDGGTEPAPAEPRHPTTVTISAEALTFTTLGDTARLTAELRDQSGKVMGVLPRWFSRNSAVAEVSSGLVRAVGSGMTVVVAEARGVADSVAITVDAPSFTVSGTVGDPRRPGMVLPGVVVHLESWKRTYAVTDSDGRYRFPNVGGTVRVTAEAAFSYASRTVEASVDADLTLDFELEHTGVPPFRGTPWANRHILGPGDSTSLRSVTFAGRERGRSSISGSTCGSRSKRICSTRNSSNGAWNSGSIPSSLTLQRRGRRWRGSPQPWGGCPRSSFRISVR